MPPDTTPTARQLQPANVTRLDFALVFGSVAGLVVSPTVTFLAQFFRWDLPSNAVVALGLLPSLAFLTMLTGLWRLARRVGMWHISAWLNLIAAGTALSLISLMTLSTVTYVAVTLFATTLSPPHLETINAIMLIAIAIGICFILVGLIGLLVQRARQRRAALR